MKVDQRNQVSVVESANLYDGEQWAERWVMFTTSSSALVYPGIPPAAIDPKRVDVLRLWLPLIFGTTAYLNLLNRTNRLLTDSDVYWLL